MSFSARAITLISAVLIAGAATAQTAPQQTPAPGPAGEPVVVPQVERKPIRQPKFASNDIEIGLFGGTYSTQNFGTSGIAGVRLGYHITEDFFVQAAYGQTKVSDDAFRQVLPGGVFVNRKETLKYTAISAGYNLLPGEAFIGRGIAKATQAYIVGGIGATDFNDQRRQTYHFGFGYRLYWNDRFVLQADVRDHVFTLDILGKRQNTQNLEVTAGLTILF
jgi:outer membrane beta-barrel protein